MNELALFAGAVTAIAHRHAEDSDEPDHEAGDLITFLTSAHALLSESVLSEVYRTQAVLKLIANATCASVAEIRRDFAERNEFPVAIMLDAAAAHGAGDAPDHEIGDLQEFLGYVFAALSDEQRVEFYHTDEVRATLAAGFGLDQGEFDEKFPVAQ